MLIEVNSEQRSPAILKVLGLGGAGGNAVNRMIASEIRGVEFLVANTDAQALGASACPHRIQIGQEVTGGLGSGGDRSCGPGHCCGGRLPLHHRSERPESDSLLLQRPFGPMRPLAGGHRCKKGLRRAINFIWVVCILEFAAGP